MAGMLGFFNLATGLGVGSFYFTYIVGNIGLQGVASAIGVILLPVMFLFPKIMNKLSAPKMIGVGMCFAVAGYAVYFIAGSNMVLIMVSTVLTSLAALPISYLQAIIIMDLSTYNEYKGLPAMTGSTGVVAGFATKVCNGLSAGLGGILLTIAGFVESTGGEAVVQPDSALMMIRMEAGLIPMIFAVISAACAFSLSKLNAKMPEIRAELEARKQEQSSEA